MTIENKFDKVFGPTGSTAGTILLFAGIAILFISWSGIFLILTGAFTAFTNTSAIINTDNKHVKYSNNIFGIIKSGKWVHLTPSMSIGIKKSKKTYRAYSRSNRVLDITNSDFRVMLFDDKNKVVMPLSKCKNLKSAQDEALQLADILNLKSKVK